MDIVLSYLEKWFFDAGIKILAIILVGFIIYKFSKPVITKMIEKIITQDPAFTKEEEERREKTLIKIINGTIKIAIIIFVFLIVLSEFGVDIGPLIAGAGIVGLALGFGGQYLVRDVINGLFIILENQYRVGDVVTIVGISGKVEDISLRITTMRDIDGTVHHIPHGDIKTVSNMAKGFSRVNININVAYDTELDKVKYLINQIGQELSKDPDYKDLIIDPPKFVRLGSFGDSALSIKILGETKPLAQWDIAGEMLRRIKLTFEKEGIEIPFPQMVIHQKD